MELTEEKMRRVGNEIMDAVEGMYRYVLPHLQDADLIVHDTSLLSKALDLIIDMHRYIEKYACKLAAKNVKRIVYDKRGVFNNTALINDRGEVVARLNVQNTRFERKYRATQNERYIYIDFDRPVNIYVIYLGTKGTLIDVPCSKYVNEWLKETERRLREVARW